MTHLFSVARRRRSLLATTLLAGAALLTGAMPAAAQDAGKKQLVIGGTAGSNIDQLQSGIVPLLKEGKLIDAISSLSGGMETIIKADLPQDVTLAWASSPCTTAGPQPSGSSA